MSRSRPPRRTAPRRQAVAALCPLLLLAASAACSGAGPFAVLASSPHEQYRNGLERAGLHETALGRDWIRVSTQTLAEAVPMPVPFAETGYFPPEEASAVAYGTELRRGRRLTITVEHEAHPDGRLFVDLFRLGDGLPERVASVEEGGRALLFEVGQDGTYALRLQPELLRGGRFTVTAQTLASLPFPVPSLAGRGIQSGFGAGRDAGLRRHEGVDIFASRGVQVTAVSDGVARPGTNALGGTVVWLRGSGATFYYAHLNSVAIDGLTRVRAGDVLGHVGNSGNARTTAPHLHFGIYDRGAIDPAPFIGADDAAPAPPRGDANRTGALVRVTASRTPLWAGPAERAPPRTTLERGAVARVLGLSGRTYRVVLPDGSIGYLAQASVGPADRPLRHERLTREAALRQTPSTDGPVVQTLGAGVQVEVVGRFGTYRLLRAPGGRAGWLGT